MNVVITMASSRSELREKCMIILYQIDLRKSLNTPYSVDEIMEENLLIENEFVKEIVYGVLEHQTEIDEKANFYVKDWTIDRLDRTGAAILRIGIFEYLYTDTPPIVIINEAVELAKKYSDESVRKMINAVLDKMIKE